MKWFSLVTLVEDKILLLVQGPHSLNQSIR